MSPRGDRTKGILQKTLPIVRQIKLCKTKEEPPILSPVYTDEA